MSSDVTSTSKSKLRKKKSIKTVEPNTATVEDSSNIDSNTDSNNNIKSKYKSKSKLDHNNNNNNIVNFPPIVSDIIINDLPNNYQPINNNIFNSIRSLSLLDLKYYLLNGINPNSRESNSNKGSNSCIDILFELSCNPIITIEQYNPLLALLLDFNANPILNNTGKIPIIDIDHNNIIINSNNINNTNIINSIEYSQLLLLNNRNEFNELLMELLLTKRNNTEKLISSISAQLTEMNQLTAKQQLITESHSKLIQSNQQHSAELFLTVKSQQSKLSELHQDIHSLRERELATRKSAILMQKNLIQSQSQSIDIELSSLLTKFQLSRSLLNSTELELQSNRNELAKLNQLIQSELTKKELLIIENNKTIANKYQSDRELSELELKYKSAKTKIKLLVNNIKQLKLDNSKKLIVILNIQIILYSNNNNNNNSNNLFRSNKYLFFRFYRLIATNNELLNIWEKSPLYQSTVQLNTDNIIQFDSSITINYYDLCLGNNQQLFKIQLCASRKSIITADTNISILGSIITNIEQLESIANTDNILTGNNELDIISDNTDTKNSIIGRIKFNKFIINKSI